jgi:hypothetical protein
MKVGILPTQNSQSKVDLRSKLYAHGITCDVKVLSIDYTQFERNPYIISLIAHELRDCDVIVGQGWGAYFAFYAGIINNANCLLVSPPLYKGSIANERFNKSIPDGLNKGTIDVSMVCGLNDTITKFQEAKSYVQDSVFGEVSSHVVKDEGYLFSDEGFFDELCNYLLVYKHKSKQLENEKHTSNVTGSEEHNKGQSPDNSVSEQKAEKTVLSKSKGKQQKANK